MDVGARPVEPVARVECASSAAPPRVGVVIVNFQTPDLTIGCLRSLTAEIAARPGARVVVVDNGSGDDSAERIAEAIEQNGWRAWAIVRASSRNLGFAGGNNFGLDVLRSDGGLPEFVLLLNPDTIVEPSAVGALVDAMTRDARIGIAGSQLFGSNGVVESSAHHAPTPLSEFDRGARVGLFSRVTGRPVSISARESAHACEWVSGASLMVRREVLEAIGGLDDGFFLYFEELDFCRRAAGMGWQVWYVPASRVMHLEGAATGIARRPGRPAYWFESRARYFIKHHGRAGLLLADVLWATGHLIRSGCDACRRRGADRGAPDHSLRELARHDWRVLVGAKRVAPGPPVHPPAR